MKKIVIIGGGFAGLWSAISAVRLARSLNKESSIEITLINKDEYHGLRPRFYEEDLSQTRISLPDILLPLGVKLMVGEVSEIHLTQQKINLKNNTILDYDRLILATGSHLHRPPVPGLVEYGFNVDTYAAAKTLGEHINSLKIKPEKGRYTIVVIGGGFVGIEVATDLVGRLKKIVPPGEAARVIVLDHNEIGSAFSEELQKLVQQSFQDLKIETKINVGVKAISEDELLLDSGKIIETQTVVWAAGMRANALTQLFKVDLDKFGRLPVDKFLQIPAIKNCFAAGDVAAAKPDPEHYALLSCQHAMPQGRVAGHNAIADLLNEPLVAYEQPRFVTIMDLGDWGAFYAEGWEQRIVEVGEPAKKIKHYINHQRIYPLSIEDNGIEALLASAEPVFKPIQI